jgi:hypothetical protein
MMTIPGPPTLLDDLFDGLLRDESHTAVLPEVLLEDRDPQRCVAPIYALRHALGQDVIETVPGRGYRLLADVSEIDDEATGELFLEGPPSSSWVHPRIRAPARRARPLRRSAPSMPLESSKSLVMPGGTHGSIR